MDKCVRVAFACLCVHFSVDVLPGYGSAVGEDLLQGCLYNVMCVENEYNMSQSCIELIQSLVSLTGTWQVK